MATKEEVKALLRGGACENCRNMISLNANRKRAYDADEVLERHCALRTSIKGEPRAESLILNYRTHSCKHFWRKEHPGNSWHPYRESKVS